MACNCDRNTFERFLHDCGEAKSKYDGSCLFIDRAGNLVGTIHLPEHVVGVLDDPEAEDEPYTLNHEEVAEAFEQTLEVSPSDPDLPVESLLVDWGVVRVGHQDSYMAFTLNRAQAETIARATNAHHDHRVRDCLYLDIFDHKYKWPHQDGRHTVSVAMGGPGDPKGRATADRIEKFARGLGAWREGRCSCGAGGKS